MAAHRSPRLAPHLVRLAGAFATAGALLVALAVTSGCDAFHDLTHEPNSGWCCITPSVCQRWSASGEPTPVPCTKPGEVCDEANTHCVPAECSSDQECSSDPARPVCADNRCVACTVEMPNACPATASACVMNACAACSDDSPCERFAETPHCGGGACVECRADVASDCAVPTPICDDGTCRSCRPGDCASGICDADRGTCIADTDVAWVAKNGQDTGTCTRSQPCLTIGRAINQLGKRPWLHVAASGEPYAETAATPGAGVQISGKTLTILGAGATLTTTRNGDAALLIEGAANVVVDGLRIADAGGTSGDGILCRNTGTAEPTLTLRATTIETNGGRGINATSCTLNIERSKISSNAQGGASLSSSTFRIRGTFITGNGNGTGVQATDFGGLRATAAGPTSVLEFTTIAGNAARSAFVSGAICTSTGTTPVRLANNIIFGNTPGSAQTSGVGCSFAYSVIGPEPQDGDHIINADPRFENADQGNYHIKAGSPAIGAADPAATLAVDFDGEARPMPANTRADVGADEVAQ